MVGRWEVGVPTIPIIRGEKGLIAKTKAAHHAISASAALNKPVGITAGPLVIQYVVVVEERRGEVKGEAEFPWITTDQKWNETFAYALDFDEHDKMKRYQVWPDSGAAYLAWIGELDQKRQELMG